MRTPLLRGRARREALEAAATAATTVPELQARVAALEAENAELRAKVARAPKRKHNEEAAKAEEAVQAGGEA